MVSRKDSNQARLKRHKRGRAKISGTAARPRLAVYRSNANISAQIIDDVKGVTLASASSYEKGFEEEYNMLCSIERLAPGIFAEEKGSTKPVCANVDLFSGLIYNMLGISEDLYTPLFAIARVPGWCAHRVEEVIFANRIIRPAYKYLGVRQKYKPIEER